MKPNMLVNRCTMGKVDLESPDQLYLHCDFVGALWELAISFLLVAWIAYNSIKNPHTLIYPQELFRMDYLHTLVFRKSCLEMVKGNKLFL